MHIWLKRKSTDDMIELSPTKSQGRNTFITELSIKLSVTKNLQVVDTVNTGEALVTEYKRDNLNTSYGGNAIDIDIDIYMSL